MKIIIAQKTIKPVYKFLCRKCGVKWLDFAAKPFGDDDYRGVALSECPKCGHLQASAFAGNSCLEAFT